MERCLAWPFEERWISRPGLFHHGVQVDWLPHPRVSGNFLVLLGWSVFPSLPPQSKFCKAGGAAAMSLVPDSGNVPYAAIVPGAVLAASGLRSLSVQAGWPQADGNMERYQTLTVSFTHSEYLQSACSVTVSKFWAYDAWQDGPLA